MVFIVKKKTIKWYSIFTDTVTFFIFSQIRVLVITLHVYQYMPEMAFIRPDSKGIQLPFQLGARGQDLTTVNRFVRLVVHSDVNTVKAPPRRQHRRILSMPLVGPTQVGKYLSSLASALIPFVCRTVKEIKA